MRNKLTDKKVGTCTTPWSCRRRDPNRGPGDTTWSWSRSGRPTPSCLPTPRRRQSHRPAPTLPLIRPSGETPPHLPSFLWDCWSISGRPGPLLRQDSTPLPGSCSYLSMTSETSDSPRTSVRDPVPPDVSLPVSPTGVWESSVVTVLFPLLLLSVLRSLRRPTRGRPTPTTPAQSQIDYSTLGIHCRILLSTHEICK